MPYVDNAEGTAWLARLDLPGDDKARLDVFIPEGAIVRSPRVGFGNPKRPERRLIDTDATALAAGSHH